MATEGRADAGEDGALRPTCKATGGEWTIQAAAGGRGGWPTPVVKPLFATFKQALATRRMGRFGPSDRDALSVVIRSLVG